jgi:benzylsuccinate CoA-transferase BbsF subunit
MSTCLNGHTGPYADLAGYGTLGAMLAGFGGLVGWPDRPPCGPYSAYTDFVSPRFVAAALLAAIDHKRRTGEGQYIDVSQVETTIHFLAPQILDYTVNGRLAERRGNASPDFAPHGVYPCAGDDRWVAIACETDAHWRGLCRALDNEALSDDPRFTMLQDRHANAAALDELLSAWTNSRDVAEVEEALQAAGVPVHRITTTDDAFADTQLLHRGHFVTVKHPEHGPVPVESSRTVLSRTPACISSPGPSFGQHNDEVLRGILGMNDDEIVELTLCGALE